MLFLSDKIERSNNMLHVKKDKKISIRIPEDLYLSLQDYGDRYGWTVSKVIRLLIDDFVRTLNNNHVDK